MNDNVTNQCHMLPGDSPTESQVGTYQAQFETIRANVCGELQSLAADYAMSLQKHVKICIGANLELNNLAERHCNNILQKFRACRANLVNHTNTSAMFEIDGKMLLVDFDLANSGHSILGARFVQPSVYDSQLAVTSGILLLRQIQQLLMEPIDDANIVVPYEQSMNAVRASKQKLSDTRSLLHEMIASRAFTAFNFEVGLSLYTVNYSEDMSMLFWDRYTITNVTAKSFYVEQHCIVEHIITGDIEPERFIEVHKPSKNSMAQFFADRFACLTSMVRPQPNVEGQAYAEPAMPTDDDEDDYFTDEELIDMGWTEEEIAEYHETHPQA